MPQSPSLADRLVEVEIALTHQQALVEELNGVVAAQAARLDLLSALAARLAQRLAAVEAALPDAAPPPDTPPPHW